MVTLYAIVSHGEPFVTANTHYRPSSSLLKGQQAHGSCLPGLGSGRRSCGPWGWLKNRPGAGVAGGTPCVTFRRIVAPLRGPGQSPVLPFACCVGLLRSVGRCGRCSCWCRYRVRGAQWLVCWGCAGCGMVCRLRVSGAQ